MEIAEHALAVLGAMLGDYTDPDEDGHCARVVVVGGSVAEGFFDVQVHRRSPAPGVAPGSAQDVRGLTFRVSVSVGLAPHPVSLRSVQSFEAPVRGD